MILVDEHLGHMKRTNRAQQSVGRGGEVVVGRGEMNMADD